MNGVPDGFPVEQDKVEKMLPDLILALSDDHMLASETMLSSMAQRFARLGTVNSEPVRNPSEAQRLIEDLFLCENTEFTGSGHRIMSVLTEEQIDKMLN